MTTTHKEIISEWRSLALEPLFNLGQKVFSDKTGMEVIEDFLLAKLIQVEQQIRKESVAEIHQRDLKIEADHKAWIIEHDKQVSKEAEEKAKSQVLASLAVEVMEVEVQKSKDPYISGHIHGVRRAIYLIKQLKFASLNPSPEAKAEGKS